MKHVDIYIEHNITRMKAESARYGYAVAFEKSTGELVYKKSFGYANNITENGIYLMALTDALSRMKEPVDINVYMRSMYLCNMINSRMYERWHAQGYKNAQGKDISNSERWARIYELSRNHLISAVCSSGNRFTEELQKELRSDQ